MRHWRYLPTEQARLETNWRWQEPPAADRWWCVRLGRSSTCIQIRKLQGLASCWDDLHTFQVRLYDMQVSALMLGSWTDLSK